jgi:hypothetical protein
VFGKLFKKPKELTFRERVDNFWTWFGTVAERLSGELKDKNTAVIAEEISERVDVLGPGFAWEVGPEGDATSLTLTGEGNLHRQLLTQFCIERAPKINGWKFYPSRQPDRTRAMELHISGKVFDGKHIWVSPTVNREEEAFDLAVWHPEWQTLDDNQRWTMLFIFLDTQLGEYGTQQWIGKIEFSEAQLKEAIALPELPAFIDEVRTREDWKPMVPGEWIILYRLEPHNQFARGDIAIGQTKNNVLLKDYLRAEGMLDDPLAGTGADYIYLTIGIEHLPKGEEVSTRSTFEDALDDGLRRKGLGRLLGGATGSRFGYIDLLVYDGDKSIAAIERVLKEQNAPTGMHLHYFAMEKRKQTRRLT